MAKETSDAVKAAYIAGGVALIICLVQVIDHHVFQKQNPVVDTIVKVPKKTLDSNVKVTEPDTHKVSKNVINKTPVLKKIPDTPAKSPVKVGPIDSIKLVEAVAGVYISIENCIGDKADNSVIVNFKFFNHGSPEITIGASIDYPSPASALGSDGNPYTTSVVTNTGDWDRSIGRYHGKISLNRKMIISVRFSHIPPSVNFFANVTLNFYSKLDRINWTSKEIHDVTINWQ